MKMIKPTVFVLVLCCLGCGQNIPPSDITTHPQPEVDESAKQNYNAVYQKALDVERKEKQCTVVVHVQNGTSTIEKSYTCHHFQVCYGSRYQLFNSYGKLKADILVPEKALVEIIIND